MSQMVDLTSSRLEGLRATTGMGQIVGRSAVLVFIHELVGWVVIKINMIFLFAVEQGSERQFLKS